MGLWGEGGGRRDGKQEREGMEHGERRMEMNNMLHDKRVHFVSSESVKCNSTADYKSFNFGSLFFTSAIHILW